MFSGGGYMCSSNGLSNHFCKAILTKRFNHIKETKLDKYQSNFDCAFNVFRMRMVIKAVQT